MPTYFTPIPATPNQIADADTFNDPMTELDEGIGIAYARGDDALSIATSNNGELVAARAPYPSLKDRLDALIAAGGNVATNADGVSEAGQKVLTVDDPTGFIVGSYVTYLLNNTTLEGNLIASIQPGVSLTLATNIGTGGVLDDTPISMISISEYLAAQAIPHAGTLLLPDTMAYANAGVFNAAAYGMSTAGTASANAAALQAAIDAAAVVGGKVKVAPGAYALTTVSLKSGVTLEGSGCGQNPIAGGAMLGTVLNIEGANYGIVMGDDRAEAFIDVRNLSIIGTSSGKAGIRLGYHQDSISHYIGNCVIDNVWVVGFTSPSVAQDVSPGIDLEPAEAPATGGAGIFLPRGITCTLRNVRCQGNYYGLYESSSHNSTTMVFDQCSFRENVKYGVRLSDFTHYTFRDCVFEANADSGLAVLPHTNTAGACSGLTLNQCYFEANGDQAGSGTELYQMYVDGVTGTAESYLGRLRMDACSFQPGATGADNAVYLKNVRQAFLTYNSFGNNTGTIFTVDATCEGILIISVDPASSTGWRGNTLAAKAVELLMSDATLTMNQGTLRLDTSTTGAPLIIRQETDPTDEQTFLSILRNDTNNVLRITADAGGDAELTMYADGGAGATYIKTGATDDAYFPSLTRVAKLGVGNSASASVIPTTGLVKKILVYDASGDPLGYIPVYNAIG